MPIDTLLEYEYRYPRFTSEEMLQGFRGKVVRGVAKDRFKSFVQRAVAQQLSQEQVQEVINLMEIDCLQELNLATLSQKITSFRGADMIFVDIPKAWKVDDLIRFLRMMKSLNLANNVEVSKFILFPVTHPEELIMQQIQMACKALNSINAKWNMAYYNDSAVTPKDNARMANALLPFIVSCGAPIVPATNIFMADNGAFVKEKDSGICSKRQKPVQLFIEIMKTFSKDKSLHIIDACSGAGSCALACSTLGRKCIIFENSLVKARLIRQRVNCSYT